MQLIIPILILLLIASSLFRGVGVYDAFLRGAKRAFPLIANILPCLAAMLCALNVFRDSGALDIVSKACKPVFEFVGIPKELITLVLLRPFSGSAAFALLDDVFKSSGVDSYPGYLASIIVGSSETIFYTVALYFGAIGVKKLRYAPLAALLSALSGLFVSVLMAKLTY